MTYINAPHFLNPSIHLLASFLCLQSLSIERKNKKLNVQHAVISSGAARRAIG